MKTHFRILGKLLFVVYIGFLFYFLIFSDWYGRTGTMQEYHYNLELFREIKRFWNYREQLGVFVATTNLLGNVVIFMPLGILIPMAKEDRGLITVAITCCWLSLAVELFQLVSKVGSFDVDDLLLNTIGGILGYMIFAVARRIRRTDGTSKTRKNKR